MIDLIVSFEPPSLDKVRSSWVLGEISTTKTRSTSCAGPSLKVKVIQELHNQI